MGLGGLRRIRRGRATRERPAAAPVEEGSNNWAIGPARSATGRPVVCNDPHRVLRNPSLRYLAHLTAPGFDAIGANEPFLPGISIGHNGHVAFGLTIFYVDQEDVYVYETTPDGRSYKYGGGHEQIRRQTSVSRCREPAPRDLVMKFTRHGPVVHEGDGPRASPSAPSGSSRVPRLTRAPSRRCGRRLSTNSARACARGARLPSITSAQTSPAVSAGFLRASRRCAGTGTGLTPARGDGTQRMGGLSRQREAAAHHRSGDRLCRFGERDESAEGFSASRLDTSGSTMRVSAACAKRSKAQDNSMSRSPARCRPTSTRIPRAS